MTDERFTFIQDLKEKNAAKTGAYHRINGSKSKRCTLPSDKLTPAQLKRRNSPVESVKLNQPMIYKDFKTLPPTLQFLYLDHLIHEYGARRMDIVNMLCISQSYWAKLVPTIPGKLEFPKGRKHPTPEWLSFIGGAAPEVEAQTPIPEPANLTLYPDPDPEIMAGSITIVATLGEIEAAISKLVDPGRTYTYTISFSRG